MVKEACMANGLILLMRHGQIVQNTPRRFVGRTDLPLDATGQEQAKAAGRWLRACLEAAPALEGIVCSDLQRTRETANYVAQELNMKAEAVSCNPGLREINLGAWEGLTKEEVEQRFPGELEARWRDMAGYRPMHGESFADVQQRVMSAFQDIARQTETLRIIVAHAGVNRALLCGLLEMPLKHIFRLGQDYCCLNLLRREQEHWTVQALNLLPWTAGGLGF